jgi:hypothetical protein
MHGATVKKIFHLFSVFSAQTSGLVPVMFLSIHRIFGGDVYWKRTGQRNKTEN